MNERNVSADADPLCRLCRGSGWIAAENRECFCRGRGPDPIVAPEREPVLSRRRRLRLEANLLGILLEARLGSAAYDAERLARIVATGAAPPSVERLAAFARVDSDSADRLMVEIRAALSKKKGTSQ